MFSLESNHGINLHFLSCLSNSKTITLNIINITIYCYYCLNQICYQEKEINNLTEIKFAFCLYFHFELIGFGTLFFQRHNFEMSDYLRH